MFFFQGLKGDSGDLGTKGEAGDLVRNINSVGVYGPCLRKSLLNRKVASILPITNNYSKHLHIRTLISGFRLIKFFFTGCLVKNQPESVLLKFVSEILHIILCSTRGLINTK